MSATDRGLAFLDDAQHGVKGAGILNLRMLSRRLLDNPSKQICRVVAGLLSDAAKAAEKEEARFTGQKREYKQGTRMHSPAPRNYAAVASALLLVVGHKPRADWSDDFSISLEVDELLAKKPKFTKDSAFDAVAKKHGIAKGTVAKKWRKHSK